MDRSGRRASLEAWLAAVDQLLDQGAEGHEPISESKPDRQDGDAA